jgi:2-oxoglutarate ferredoxin oxidoreductase subunit beta
VSTTPLTKKDFQTDQEVRWCPGCGDYAILNAVQQVFPELGVPREKFVIVSGIGCSSRFPYYMNTYGFHTIHGRAPAVATGVKLANPELSVWVVTGDGDALSIGGNHLIHAMRRNIDLKILLFNNRIYGLTKGQYSPTSERGKKTKSSPLGTVERPFMPACVAVGTECTFVARAIDVQAPHLKAVIKRAHEHHGTAFVEILQNCNIFNDAAWAFMTEKDVREDQQLVLEHGKPMIFGKGRDKGLRLSLQDLSLDVVSLADVAESEILVHDETNRTLAFLLSQVGPPLFPTPIGVIYKADAPTHDEGVTAQLDEAIEKQGPGDLAALLNSGDTWVVK